MHKIKDKQHYAGNKLLIILINEQTSTEQNKQTNKNYCMDNNE